jgi:hypothetical protein
VSASAGPSLSLVGLAAMLAMALAMLVAPLSLTLPLTLTAQAQPVSSTRTVFATDFQRVEGLAFDANGNLYIADYVSWGVETAQRSDWPVASISVHSHPIIRIRIVGLRSFVTVTPSSTATPSRSHRPVRPVHMHGSCAALRCARRLAAAYACP